MNRNHVLACMLTSLLALPAFAEETPGVSSGHDMRFEMPPEAYKACEGKKEGDTVLYTNHQGRKIPAACVKSSKGLIALPKRHD